MQRQLNWSLIFVVCVMSVFIASKANAQWVGEEFRVSSIGTITTDAVQGANRIAAGSFFHFFLLV